MFNIYNSNVVGVAANCLYPNKIEIKDNSMREWKEIRLEDGKVGWIPASAIEVI